jgi:hypothetical protein
MMWFVTCQLGANVYFDVANFNHAINWFRVGRQ